MLRSIGYRSQPLDGHMPFDSANGVVPNKLGRVTGCAGEFSRKNDIMTENIGKVD